MPSIFCIALEIRGKRLEYCNRYSLALLNMRHLDSEASIEGQRFYCTIQTCVHAAVIYQCFKGASDTRGSQLEQTSAHGGLHRRHVPVPALWHRSTVVSAMRSCTLTRPHTH